ncbi:MAG: hypothetical protein F6J95_013025 [Leptolyngbya sp. SIO1E4]|nr:hypothetical protein [Leptolyngbya sp. SIO1E4]
MLLNMSKWIYKRYWYPRSEDITPDWDGYLPEPKSDWGRASNPNLVTLSDISGLPCLVLLGEAGMGKTTALEFAHQQTYEQTKSSEDVCLPLFRLGDYGSDTELCNAVFRNPVFQEWLSGEHKIYLFLDSLDEGLLSIKILVRILKREIESLPCDRLYFRITCRATEWPASLEKVLKEKWEKDKVEIYTLAPLTRTDVAKAAGQKGIVDTDKFLKEISEKNAVPLAIKPITLKFLINLYSQDKRLPTSQVKLYELGCLQLCTEANPDRLEAGWSGKHSETKRKMIAGRIAAVMIFSNRASIWIGSDYGNVSDSDILLHDLCIGKGKIGNQEFDVDEDCIEEVLEITGLFSTNKYSQRIEFSHRTYAEFLAAWYLKQRQLEIQQILQLIIHPNDSDSRLVPQLHETVAWLASMSSEVFRSVMETDPDVLLRSDIQTATDSECSALVENLLRLYDEGKLVNDILNNYGDYKKLNHDSLSLQLRPYICESARNLNARYVAIDIAEACEQKSLQNELATVALNFSEPPAIRRNAACAVCRIGDAPTKKKLINLALEDSGDDPNDEIKGYALKAVYPDHISTVQLFNAITLPKAQFFGGTYQHFIAEEIVENFQPSDILIALKWIEGKSRRGLKYPFQQLFDAILLKTWENLENLEVLERFSKVVVSRWQNHEPLFSHRNDPSFEENLIRNDEKRHKLLETIVSVISSLNQRSNWILGSRAGVILQKDIIWMLERIKQSGNEQETLVWAHLIRRTFRYPEKMSEEAIAILDVSQRSKHLHDEFSFWLKTIDLNSAKSVKLYTAYLEQKAWENEDQNPNLVAPPPNERIVNCLNSFEAGDIGEWWNLNLQLTLLPTSQYYDDICRQLDIKKLPGWENSDDSTRLRIVEAAEFFLERWESESIDLNLHEIDVAAYKAIRLLLTENPISLSILSNETWRQFARILLLVYPYTSDSRYVDDHHEIMKIAYQHAPQEATRILMASIDEDNRKHNDIHILSAFQECWDDYSLSALSDKILDNALSPESFGRLLGVLLNHECEKALEIARSHITQPLPSGSQKRLRAIFAAVSLMFHTRDAGWPMIWQTIQQDSDFGRELFKRISYLAKWDGNLEVKLREEYIANLFIFLAKEFPEIEKESNINSSSHKNSAEINPDDYRIDEEDSINIWKDYIPQRLQARGTREACDALRRIIDELPELKDKLQWRLLEAEALTRRITWQPPKPSDVVQIIFERDRRLVQTGNQLLEVLSESLARLELELQGETPAVRDLWDKVSGNSFRPLDENAFSDYVKRFLDRDLKSRGIIANREVELRRPYGSNPGERTDIHIDAVLKQPNDDAYDVITAIVEVKGCWHGEIQSAMKTQLVDRYLTDNACLHGLYLVGWFNCQQWDRADSRKTKTPKMTLEEARAYFDRQAEEFTSSRLTVHTYVLNAALR